MASPYNYTISSIIVNNLDNTDNETESEADGNDYLDLEDHDEDYSMSDIIFPPVDVDSANTADSDTEDVSSEFLEEDIDTTFDENEVIDTSFDESEVIDTTYDGNEVDDTESSTQVESDIEADEDVVPEPEQKRARLEESEQSEDTESVDPNQKCPICLAAWTNIGEHRLCSLRCGHLFGRKCIKQWLNSGNPSCKKCPQCNSRASVRHIRLIYSNKLTCVDTSQIEKMKKQLEESNVKLSKISKALAKQKRKTKKYKQMYKARTLALTVDSDFGFSD